PFPLRHRVPSLAVRPSQDVGPCGLTDLLLSLARRGFAAAGGRRLPVELYHAESDPVRLLVFFQPRRNPVGARRPRGGQGVRHRTTRMVPAEGGKVRVGHEKEAGPNVTRAARSILAVV